MKTMNPTPAAENLFSVNQLEQWKDELAAWWGVERLRYDHKRTVILLKKWLKLTRKDAIAIEYSSREEPEKLIELFLNSLISELKLKFHNKKMISKLDLKISFQYGAFAVIEFPAGSGEIIEYDVNGHAGLIGTVTYIDGTKQKIFQRFITHPFWQYSHTSILGKANG